MEPIIKIENLTKDYGKGRGIFDVDLEIQPGEVFGIVGINGSGKTTTLRHLMGFIKPKQGKITIKGKDAWKHSAELKKTIGYIPGEIAFPDTKTGMTFLKMQSDFLHIQNSDKANELIQDLKLDTEANIKRMSKGMKQKTAIVEAFMADKDILLLDEPTTGLDPVMRDVFIQLVQESKMKGKTIVMSSHMFNEMEPTCDRIAFLQNGKIVDIIDRKKMAEFSTVNKVTIEFESRHNYDTFIRQEFNFMELDTKKNSATFLIEEQENNKLFDILATISINNISFVKQTLDDYFEEKMKLGEV